MFASLHHHVHGRQHTSTGLQSDGWNRFVAGRATGSVDDQVGDHGCKISGPCLLLEYEASSCQIDGGTRIVGRLSSRYSTIAPW